MAIEWMAPRYDFGLRYKLPRWRAREGGEGGSCLGPANDSRLYVLSTLTSRSQMD